jgi:hypothetical protein
LVPEVQGILAMLLGQEAALGQQASSAVEQTAAEETWALAAVYLLSEKTALGVVALAHLQRKKRRRRMSPAQMPSGRVSARRPRG